MARIDWPDGKAFAFTIFDDTDFPTLDNVGPVYALLDFPASRAGGGRPHVITAGQRRSMEWRWLRDKILLGGST